MPNGLLHLLVPGLLLAGTSIILLMCAFGGGHWYDVDSRDFSDYCARAQNNRLLPVTEGNLSANADIVPNSESLETPQVDVRRLHKREISGREVEIYFSNDDAITWYKTFFNRASANLHSFAGRDLFVRESNVMGTCQHLQFSTGTGLWRTCYQYEEKSLLDQLVRKRYTEECAWIKYGSLDNLSIPTQLNESESLSVTDDEMFFLAFRRLILAFLVLALLMQVFGAALVAAGCFRDDTFMRFAGGVVLLIAAVLLLAGMVVQHMMVKMQLSRSPEEIFAIPVKVKHGHGSSNHLAWTSFTFNVLASVLCAYGSRVNNSGGQTGGGSGRNLSRKSIMSKNTMSILSTKKKRNKQSPSSSSSAASKTTGKKSTDSKQPTSRLERRAMKESQRTNKPPSLRYQSSFEKNMIDSSEPIGWWRPLSKAS